MVNGHGGEGMFLSEGKGRGLFTNCIEYLNSIRRDNKRETSLLEDVLD